MKYSTLNDFLDGGHFPVINIENATAIRYSTRKKSERVRLYLPQYMFIVVLSGKKDVICSEGTISLVEKDFLFLKKGKFVMNQISEQNAAFESLVVSLDLQFLSGLQHPVQLVKDEPINYVKTNCDVFLFEEIRNIINLFSLESNKIRRVLITKLSSIIIYLTETNSSFRNMLDSILLEDMQSGIENKLISSITSLKQISDMARKCNMSPSTFKRKFKEELGTTPNAWLNERKIQISLDLLNDFELSVSDIAFMSGFDDLSHFIKTFSKRIGCSPGQYRKKSMV